MFCCCRPNPSPPFSCSPTLHSVSDTDTQGTISVTDTCAGPEIAPFDDGEQFDESEFRPATEVFSGGDLDFLQQHGTTSSSVSHLARQSLYVKFDPLIGGRPSVMGRPSMAPFKTPAGVESLIDMQSQSPCRRLEETVQETGERRRSRRPDPGDPSAQNWVECQPEPL